MSVRHVVSWTVSPENTAQLPQLAIDLKALEDTVPGVEAIEVGLNSLPIDGNWDMVLIAEFPDAAALDAYQVDPNHVAVAKKIKAIATARSAVDYTM